MIWVESVCWRSYKLPQRLEGCGSKPVCGIAPHLLPRRTRHGDLNSAIAPRDQGDEAGAMPLGSVLGAGPTAPLTLNWASQTQDKAESLFLAATAENPWLLAFAQKRFASWWKHLIARTPPTGSQRGCAKASVPTGITLGKSNTGVEEAVPEAADAGIPMSAPTKV